MGKLSKKFDVEQEKKVMAAISAATGYEMYKMHDDFCPFDLYGTRKDHQSALFEVKTRTHTHDTYPTVFLSLRKVVRLNDLALSLGWKPVFVANFKDSVFVKRILYADLQDFAVKPVGRKDRGLTNDTELCYLLPVAKMSRLV